MKTMLTLLLCIVTASLYSMEHRPGDVVNWHQRTYTVTNRRQDSHAITITMERPTMQCCGLTISKDKITRIYRNNSGEWVMDNHGEHITTALGKIVKGGTMAMILGTFLMAAQQYAT